MEKPGFGLDGDSATCDQKQINRQESRLLSIQRCIKYLIHACQCRDADCRLPSCQKMKRVVQHRKSCKQKKGRGCPICKKLIALCCYHAKQCQEAECPVTFCVSIKTKLRHQQLRQRLQQAQILKRRIATMQNRGISCPVVQTSPGNSNSNSIGNSSMGPPQVIPNPGPSFEGMQRPTHAYQQLLQTLKSPPSAQQQQQQQMLLNEGNKVAPSQTVRYKLQHLLAMQRQQQQPNQFPHPQPPMYPQRLRMPIPMSFGHQQGFQGDNSQFQFHQQPQQILMQPQIKQMASPTHPPVSPQQGILGHPQGPVPSTQQLMQQVRSPPPTAVQLVEDVSSPQPVASPRTQNNTQPIRSPRQPPVPSHTSQSLG